MTKFLWINPSVSLFTVTPEKPTMMNSVSYSVESLCEQFADCRLLSGV